MKGRTVEITSFDTPESSTVASGRYDETTGTMFVVFKDKPNPTSGEILFREYRYDSFPPELWTQFAMAESKGRFFNRNIRPLYSGKRV